jgi:hypothetical protein
MGRYVAIEPNLLRVLADQCANAADAYYDNVQVARRSLAAASLEIDIPAVDTAVRSERERLRQRAADVEEWNASYHASWRHPSRPSARVVQLSREFGGKPVPLPPVLRRRAADRDVAELVDLANNPSPARLRAVIADLRAHWDDPAFALEFAKRVAALKLTWVNDPIRDLVGPTALLVCVAQGIDPAEPGGLEHLFFEAAIPILALASPHLTGSETRALFANASDEMLGAARENADSFDPHALAQLAGEVVDQLPVDDRGGRRSPEHDLEATRCVARPCCRRESLSKAGRGIGLPPRNARGGNRPMGVA